MNIIDKIRKINRISALHLKRMKHPRIQNSMVDGIDYDTDQLREAMTWRDTPQGVDYWIKVHRSIMLQN